MVKLPTFDQATLARSFLLGLIAVTATCAFLDLPAERLTLVPCPVLAATGVPCPGCGMTRSCVALVSGNVGEAWQLHPFAFLLVAVAACVALVPRQSRSVWQSLPSSGRNCLAGVAIALCLGRWVLQLV